MTDPILAAKNIAELMTAIDAVYGLDLPTSMPPGGTLAEFWAAAVTVSKSSQAGVAYNARGITGLPLPPAPPATVFVRVDEPDDPSANPFSTTHP